MRRIELGFPTVTRAQLDENTAILVRIDASRGGSRWNLDDVERGQIRSLGPSGDHLGFESTGLNFLMVVFDVDALAETADMLGLDVHPTELRGPLPRTAQLDEAFDLVARSLDDGNSDTDPHGTRHEQRFLAAVAAATARGSDVPKPVPRRSIHSKQIVARCVDYVENVSVWTPSISELVAVAATSERRMREAFTEVVGMPPVRYFRARGLHMARNLLGTQSADVTTVIDVAYSLGFSHGGRFAHEYQRLFSEVPSQTLRSHH